MHRDRSDSLRPRCPLRSGALASSASPPPRDGNLNKKPRIRLDQAQAPPMIVTPPSPAFDRAHEAWTSRWARYPPERVMPGSVTTSVGLTACRITGTDPKPNRIRSHTRQFPVLSHPKSPSFHRPRAQNEQQASASHMETKKQTAGVSEPLALQIDTCTPAAALATLHLPHTGTRYQSQSSPLGRRGPLDAIGSGQRLVEARTISMRLVQG